jgi:hypothetical protein
MSVHDGAPPPAPAPGGGETHDWVREFPGAVTVCDTAGVVVYLNDRAVETFLADGGAALIGSNVLDCHPEPARSLLAELLCSGGTHVYTIEKAGVKKLIYQAPWRVGGEYRGLIELSLPLPEELPHFVRAG